MTVESYRTYVIDPGLERAGLFALLAQRYAPRTALYPGCSLHITPSFYIPHVVYVDRSEMAAKFFGAQEDVMAYVAGRRAYRGRPYLRFLQRDYTQPLPLRPESFDLLIALYASGVAQAGLPYLRRGGLLLTDNHRGNGGEAFRAPAYDLCAAVHASGTAYRLEESGLERYFIPSPRQPPAAPWPVYRENADYYLFRKKWPPTPRAALA